MKKIAKISDKETPKKRPQDDAREKLLKETRESEFKAPDMGKLDIGKAFSNVMKEDNKMPEKKGDSELYVISPTMP